MDDPHRDAGVADHCRRCGAEIPPGSNSGRLELLEQGEVRFTIRACRECTREAIDFLTSGNRR